MTLLSREQAGHADAARLEVLAAAADEPEEPDDVVVFHRHFHRPLHWL